MFEPEIFPKQMNCIAVLVTLLGLLGAARNHSAPGELCPLAPPSLRPLLLRAATRLNKP